MQDYFVWEIIDSVIPEPALTRLQAFRDEVTGHRIVNDMVMKYYPCERVVKYNIIKNFLKNKRDVTVFEMNIDNSRLDLGRINGNSYGYEIKTELDNLLKLRKQLDDYSKVLEYVYVIAHPRHLAKIYEMAPDHCGIIIYEISGKKFSLHEEKPASLSPCIDINVQVRNLTSKDIEFILKQAGEKNIPTTRKEREEILYRRMPELDFNEFYKLALKKRLGYRWEYVRKVFKQVQPIDVQGFYAIPADPYWVYYKHSSMV